MALPPLVLRIVADSKGVTTGVTQAQRQVNGLRGSIQRNAGLIGFAVVGAGVAVTKMALDYDQAFTKIDAVSNASRKDIEAWRGEVLRLSGETAQAPQELADALFFLASAGLKAKQIMPVLGASAKASAAGLGDTADIARLTANALNAYASSGLKAAEVTDVLVAAVREGTAEPDEFADAMGRILPVASKAGITFDQVAASLATVSNIGLDVNEGVTAMRGVLAALLAPGTQAAETLEEIGLSATEVRDSLAKDGLLDTLNMLDEAANGNIDTLREIIPNIRSMTGAFALTQQEAEKVDAIFRRVDESTGSLDKAFKTTAKGASFQLEKAMNQLRVAGVKLGQQLIPALTVIARAISKIVTNATIMMGAVARAAAWFNEKFVQPTLQAMGNLVDAIAAGVRFIKNVFVAAWNAIKGPVLAVINAIADGVRVLYRLVVDTIAAIRELSGMSDFNAQVEGILEEGGVIPPRQAGGPVRAMRPYIVGEAGPELFVPRVSGTVMANGEWPTPHVTVYIGEEKVEGVVVRALNKAGRR